MKYLKLYHFASEKDMSSIKKFGITEGILALSAKPDPANLKRNIFEHMRMVQWLTNNPNFIALDAPVGPPRTSMYPGRKSQYRVTVNVPQGFQTNTPKWGKFARIMKDAGYLEGPQLFKLDPAMEKEINIDLGNPNEWWVFCGRIPPQWISAPTPNPSIPRIVADLSSA